MASDAFGEVCPGVMHLFMVFLSRAQRLGSMKAKVVDCPGLPDIEHQPRIGLNRSSKFRPRVSI